MKNLDTFQADQNPIPPVGAVEDIQALLDTAIAESLRDENVPRSIYFTPFNEAECGPGNAFHAETANLAEKSPMRRLAVMLYNEEKNPADVTWTKDQLVAAFNNCPKKQALLEWVANKAPVCIQYEGANPHNIVPKEVDTLYIMGHGDATVDHISPDKIRKFYAPEIVKRMDECFPDGIGKIHLNNCGASIKFQDSILKACEEKQKFAGVEVVAFGPTPEGEEVPGQKFQPGARTELYIRANPRTALNEGMRSLRPMETVEELSRTKKTIPKLKDEISGLEKEVEKLTEDAQNSAEVLLRQKDALEKQIPQDKKPASVEKKKTLLAEIRQIDSDISALYGPANEKENELAEKRETLKQAEERAPELKKELKDNSVRAALGYKQKAIVPGPKHSL